MGCLAADPGTYGVPLVDPTWLPCCEDCYRGDQLKAFLSGHGVYGHLMQRPERKAMLDHGRPVLATIPGKGVEALRVGWVRFLNDTGTLLCYQAAGDPAYQLGIESCRGTPGGLDIECRGQQVILLLAPAATSVFEFTQKAREAGLTVLGF